MLKASRTSVGGSVAPRWREREDGFTLVELLVTMLIMGILMTTVIGIYVAFQQSSSETMTMLQEEQQLDDVINVVSNQLREAIVDPSAAAVGATNVLVPPTTLLNAARQVVFDLPPPGVPVPSTTDGVQALEWVYTPGAAGHNATLQQIYGTVTTNTATTPPSETFTPTTGSATTELANILVDAQFCYMDANGDNMTALSGCPGKTLSTPFTVDEVATCAVAVFVVIDVGSQFGVTGLKTTIGIGFRNQTVQSVQTYADDPAGAQTC